jgi:hypothetical protein
MSTDSVRDLSPGDRRCHFDDDVFDSDLFSVYSHSGCIFECMAKQESIL